MDDAITKEEYASLSTPSAIRTWLSIFGDYAVIVGLLAIAIFIPYPLVIMVVVLLMARQQHALSILVHEGVHYRLLRSKTLNDIVTRWLLAGPILLSYDGYRHTHLGHHRYTMTEKDPDYQFVQGFPMSRQSLVKGFIADFTGVSYLYLLYHYGLQGREAVKSDRKFILSMLPGVSMNILLCGILFWLGQLPMYFICWLMPMFIVLPFFLHLRGICEHGGQKPNRDPMKCTWTIINPIQTFFIAPHHINYHMEHHGYPAIPHFNLPRMHKLLKARGVLPLENVHASYRSIIQNNLIKK